MVKENKTMYVILGLLSHTPMTGYDIKKRIDSTLKYFWGASFGSIYPALGELEKQKFVTRETLSNEKGREKKGRGRRREKKKEERKREKGRGEEERRGGREGKEEKKGREERRKEEERKKRKKRKKSYS